jgi:ubiquitin carboxyl-terminal hydrolase 4/11/15
LFYRRRSEIPLGGPRFQQIFQDYDNPPEPSADDETESGEDQRLVADSSLRGSSSALTGVGAAHHRQNLGSTGEEMMTVNPRAIEGPPSYGAHEMNDEDAAPLLLRDANMNDGMQLQESIEDEGIDMSMGYNTLSMNNMGRLSSGLAPIGIWNFDGLNSDRLGQNRRGPNMISGAGSDVDESSAIDLDGSEIVQHNSSASTESLRGRLEDFKNAIPEGDDGVFEEPSPVPDMDEDAMDITMIHHQLQAQREGLLRPEFKVTAGNEDDEVEEPATEIHVEEGEGLKG